MAKHKRPERKKPPVPGKRRHKKPRVPGKRSPNKFARGFADLPFVQNKILELRNAADYQAAVAPLVANNYRGSGAMATGSSVQQVAVRLLIGTWEAIANMVSSINQVGQESIFGTTPVGFMYDALSAAIVVIQQNDSNPNYATKFTALDQAYTTWIGTKGAEYQSLADQGLNANFG